MAYFLTEALQTESQTIWGPYTANSNPWCGGLDTAVTLSFFRCIASRLLEALPRQTGCKITRAERIHSPLNPSQISPDTEDLCFGHICHICQEITLLGKHTNNNMSKDSRREEGHLGGVTRSEMILGFYH